MKSITLSYSQWKLNGRTCIRDVLWHNFRFSCCVQRQSRDSDRFLNSYNWHNHTLLPFLLLLFSAIPTKSMNAKCPSVLFCLVRLEPKNSKNENIIADTEPSLQHDLISKKTIVYFARYSEWKKDIQTNKWINRVSKNRKQNVKSAEHLA